MRRLTLNEERRLSGQVAIGYMDKWKIGKS
jgi:hypothetical protein